MGLTTSQLRTQVGLAKDERKQLMSLLLRDLEKRIHLNEIAEKMVSKDSSVRLCLMRI
jgi:predicted transcriptional regulator with HTH domain